MNNELHKLRDKAERLHSDPEAARKLFVQAGIYAEEGNLREAFGGTMNKEKPMSKQFDLKAAKRGEPILYDGEPATFVAYLPENKPDWRVVISVNGEIRTITDDGRYCIGADVRLTMAPRKDLT